MAGFSVKGLAIARVYGAAMIELAEAKGDVDGLLDELEDLAGQVERQDELRSFVTDPTIDMASRARTLDKLFRGRYTELFVDSLQVLNQKGRLGLLGAVAIAYRAARDDRQGCVEVHVQTATALTDDLRARIKAVAAKRSGKEPRLVETVDPSLLGGVVMRIGDVKYDASVATKLKRLRDELLDRAAREIHGGKSYFEGAAV